MNAEENKVCPDDPTLGWILKNLVLKLDLMAPFVIPSGLVYSPRKASIWDGNVPLFRLKHFYISAETWEI